MTRRAAPALTLVLVRHGETEGQSSIRYHGRTDVALSELGRAQMRAVRRELERRDFNFDRAFASPLVRATEGAALILGDGAGLITLEEFTEVHFGLFEGLTADEIRERFPLEFERWNADRLAPAYTYPQGESRAAFAERVERGLERMLKLIEASRRSGHERALVVAHRGVIRAMVRALTGDEPAVELGSIQVLAHEGRWRTHLLDFVAHL